MQTLYMTGFAVRGDPAYGRDSALNEALYGYTRERAVQRAKIRRAAAQAHETESVSKLLTRLSQISTRCDAVQQK